MEELLGLILLCIAMFVGCYLAGSGPLAFTFSEDKLRKVTVFGAGLLVGTALAVIIPEGVHALLASPHGHEAVKETLANVVKSAESGAADEHKIPETHHSHDDHAVDLHRYIGVALVLGFIFMLFVDHIGESIHSRASADVGSSGLKITATLGLVVHAAADGIAMGAAVSSKHKDTELIVFIAIMLHKAPAAFGLVSFLLHEGFDRTRVRKHLAVFSASAPLTALITYFSLDQGDKQTLTDINLNGIAMLFSGGTFLYVATVHILSDLIHSKIQSQSTLPDSSVVVKEHSGFSRVELLLMVSGSLLPLILTLGHHH